MARVALKQRGSLHIWFDPETVWLAKPSGRRGRSATFTDAAIQACLTLKALFGLPLRQTTGLVSSLLALAGLDWPVPDFSTLSRRQKGLNVAIAYRQSTGALHLLVGGDLAQQFGQHGRISDAAAGDLDGPDLQCVGVDAKMHLAPLPGLGRPVFLGKPLPFALGLDPGAVYQEMQCTRAGAIRDGDAQTFLAA